MREGNAPVRCKFIQQAVELKSETVVNAPGYKPKNVRVNMLYVY
jgi:hypothetical protein